MKLLCGDLQQVVELGKEGVDALLFVLYAHALDGQFDDVDGTEAQVAASDARLRAEAVLEHTCTAAHRSALPLESLRVVGLPVLVLVEGRIQVDEVGEETSCRHLACILVQVIVPVGGQIADAALLLPYLYGEDGCFAIAHTLVGALENLSDDASSLGTGVRSIVDAAEYHLVSSAAVYGVHVVDECLHCLVHPAYGLVDGVLLDALTSLKSGQRYVEVVVDGCIVEFAIVFGVEVFQHLHLFYI